MSLRKAAEKALEAFERYRDTRLVFDNFSEEIAALRAALAEADEPVAWFESPYGEVRVNPLYKFQFPSSLLSWQIPLYTHPPRREPLADWAIETIAACCVKGEKSVEWALRAVERAHGIGTDE